MERHSHNSADDRTLMAEERTFSAWVRTGLTSIATGLGIAKLLPQVEPIWIMQGLGVVLVLVGGLAFGCGFWGYRRGARNWGGAHTRAVPLWLFGVFSILLVISAGLALLVIVV